VTRVAIDDHRTLRVAAFTTVLSAPFDELTPPAWLRALLSLDAQAPIHGTEALRVAVRQMLRHGGYKPAGRGKPASEYLVRAAQDGTLRSINTGVDVCNVVSLHSGFPISVIDLDRAAPPFRITIAADGVKYVFNAAGQEIDVSGLVCLFDAEGACGNAVRDAQRTKTTGHTLRTLSVIWGCAGFEHHLERAREWYHELLSRVGAECAAVDDRRQA
jgi:DNA/RNA-binding domain of Phe-tRNA-synthetase-like protein